MASEQHSEAVGFPPFNPEWFPSQIFWLAVSFGILYLVLWRRILPQLGGVIEQRHDLIAKDLDEAGRDNDQADEVSAAREERIRQAYRTASAKIAAQKSESDTIIAAELAELDFEMEKELTAARAKIADKRRAAITSLDEATGAIASGIVEKLTGNRPDPDSLQKAIAPVLAKVLH